MTGHELNDIGSALSWGAFASFLSHTQPDSAIMKELNPDVYAWSNTMKTNAILADIYDLLAIINANLTAIGSGRPAKRPKPYPRPGKQENEDERHFGRGALPPDELRKWIEEKRTRHAGSSTGDNNRNTGT